MKYIFAIVALLSALYAQTMTLPKEAKCLIRKLNVYESPTWAATIQVRSGEIIYFSSPKSMFEFYFQPGRWPEYQVKHEDDMRIFVTDFVTLQKIPAKEAYYVYGSKQTSPAGDDLPAFASKEEATQFATKYDGKRVLDFLAVSEGLINLLNNRLR